MNLHKNYLLGYFEQLELLCLIVIFYFQNIHNSDAATPPPTLDATIDLKTRLKQRTLSVNALKGRISKLRLENERLKVVHANKR